ncbi:MAG: response regulator [Thermomicrobia bacterium]|nr:response regulator [Thermomicrobia bacterium]
MAKSLIAVVNDDTLFLELMHDLLTQEGYRTAIWKEGDKAYEMIKEHRPVLVILDIRMERPDTGWMVLELMRLDPATAQIPVIICSADTARIREKEAYLREKGCDVLEKPFLLEDLLERVHAFIGPASEQ